MSRFNPESHRLQPWEYIKDGEVDFRGTNKKGECIVPLPWTMKGSELHRWLFHDKDGKEIKFHQKNMPFVVFKPNATWGGSCEIGAIDCCVRIRHNSDGEKGKRLEIWFPYRDNSDSVPIEKATLVGYMAIQGSFQKKTGKCIFRQYREPIPRS